ncbi:MAG TPA: transketolase family protein [Dehalococcoidia bacterium]|nr:transketolase family protein [Dehalococcoidia bacterium]
MTEAATREAYGRTLVEMGKANRDIVVLDADLAKSTMTIYFAREFPDRFFDCGLAEQNMIGIAAGFAASGKIPFASTFAVFASSRCFDQVRMSLGQQHLNIKVVATHSGVSVGEDGASHQAIEDLALYCSLPGVNVIVPADAIQTAAAVRYAANTEGPFYIRLNRPKLPIIYESDYKFNFGKGETLRDGNDITVIATGIMVARALEAADNLEKSNIHCRVINMHTLKPIDEDAVIRAARETEAIITAEEHLLHGGLGSMVAQIVCRESPVRMAFIGINDKYTKSGKPEELLTRNGLTSQNIEKTVLSMVAKK